MTVTVCGNCAVEHAEPGEICVICADEREWVPAEGQRWTTPEELAAEGTRTTVRELEPGLIAVGARPSVGIGQTSLLVTTSGGNVLWDPLGFLDDDGVAAVLRHGEVVAVVASHPHMFGVQVEWSRRLGELSPAPGITLSQPGGHFPGSAVLHWADGAEGRGALLTGDTIFPNPDRTTVGFLRSYPNLIPLSGAVAQRIAAHVERYDFDRIYGNFANVVPRDGRAAVRRSADRHAAWARGDHDDLT